MTHPFRRTLISIAVDQVIGQRPDPIKLELDQLWLEAGRRLLPLDRSHVTDLGIGYHAAMHAIAHGDGTIDHAGTLACVANIAMLLVEQGLGDDEHLQVIQQAQDSLVVMLQRGQRHGRYLLDGTGLTRVNEMLAIHDEQLSHPACTPALVQSALIEVRRRMAAGNTLEIA